MPRPNDDSSRSAPSAPALDKSNDKKLPPTTSRPKPYTAATVIPTLPPLECSQTQRGRSRTNSARPSANPASRRRAGTTPHDRLAPLDVELASLSVNSSGSQRLASLPEVLKDRPSSPIPIPPRQRGKSPPTAPLTARARSPVNYFGVMNPRQHISDSLTPYYTTNAPKTSESQPPSSVPVVQRGFTAMGPRPGSPLYGYKPTSPLSPTMPPQSLSGTSRPKERRPAMNMNLSGLPKFHPANFPSKDSVTHPPSPRSSRSVTSLPRPARGSDAQQKLHQYQRELIANATQSSRSLLSGSLGTKPVSPRLTPLRSPVDPMTPLVLEGRGDYLLAGSSPSSPNFEDGDGRDMVEQLVRRENERRRHPEARSRSVSPALSPALGPAVSPAGGRG